MYFGSLERQLADAVFTFGLWVADSLRDINRKHSVAMFFYVHYRHQAKLLIEAFLVTIIKNVK